MHKEGGRAVYGLGFIGAAIYFFDKIIYESRNSK